MRAFMGSLLLTAALFVGACTAEKPPVFRVEQRREAPVPNVAGVVVQVSDIGVGGIKKLTVKDTHGKELATGGTYKKGDTLRFEYGGAAYDVVVDKVDYHFTSADFASLYVERAK